MINPARAIGQQTVSYRDVYSLAQPPLAERPRWVRCLLMAVLVMRRLDQESIRARLCPQRAPFSLRNCLSRFSRRLAGLRNRIRRHGLPTPRLKSARPLPHNRTLRSFTCQARGQVNDAACHSDAVVREALVVARHLSGFNCFAHACFPLSLR